MKIGHTTGAGHGQCQQPFGFGTQTLSRRAPVRTNARSKGLTLFATVASSAPFVGLLGTVWGIYRTPTTVAADGQMDINAIVFAGR